MPSVERDHGRRGAPARGDRDDLDLDPVALGPWDLHGVEEPVAGDLTERGRVDVRQGFGGGRC